MSKVRVGIQRKTKADLYGMTKWETEAWTPISGLFTVSRTFG
jgi:hypothetical protein